LCNREIKFDVFLKIAFSLGADFVATGHYCQKGQTINREGVKSYHLLAGEDKNKDQSYFLCQVTQEQLSKVLFPIGHLKKAEVRSIATTQNLVTAEKKDSQGLCFIGKVSLPDFLQQQLKPKMGSIIEIPASHPAYLPAQEFQSVQEQSYKKRYNPEDGVMVGEHNGAHFFTVGQRKGLGVGGKVEPLFVIDTDVSKNTIYVGQGKQHPGLFREALRVDPSEIHWIRTDLSLSTGETLEVLARIRYRQPLQKARLFQTDKGLYVTFETPQSSITSGQFVAWYHDNELLGSGVIS